MKRAAGRYSCGALLACVAIALGGCGGESGGHLDAYAAAHQLATEATQRVCGILEACCNDANFRYDEQGCQAFHANTILQHFNAEVFFGSQLDTEAAQRCLDSIGQVSDGCPVDRVGGYLTEACEWLFKGTVPLGGECNGSHGCASTPEAPLLCDIDFDVESGKYAKAGMCIVNRPLVYAHGSAGQACSVTCIGDEKDPCGDSSSEGACYTGDGLFCSWESNQCEPQGVSGEPCNGSDECASGTYCDLEESKCAPIRPLGEPCSEWAECGENYCTSGTCQTPPRATAEFCVGKLPPPPSN